MAVLSTELTDTKKKQVVARINQSALIADAKIKDWLVPAISGTYATGMTALHEEIAEFGIQTGLGKITVQRLTGVTEMQPHLLAVNSLLSDAYLDFGAGITGFVREAEHILNDALKRQIQSKIGTGRLLGDDILTIRKGITKDIADRGFGVLIDKGGRQWTLERYGEMLARTHIIKANTEATLNRGRELGIDIFEVSSHGAGDSICAPLEGKKFSVSGKSPNFPPLVFTPPFHPNCRHTLLPRPDLT